MKFYFGKKDCLKPALTSEVFFWNMMGSLSSSLVSIIFSVIVARLCIPAHSDIFSIAFALASQIWTIGNFESGTLQVTDSKNKYSPDNYFSFKMVMLALSLLAAFVVIGINLVTNSYDFYKAAVVFAFCIYRIAEAFSNYYYAVFQKNEHLNVGGYSMFARTVVSAVVFAAALVITKQLLVAIVAITAASLLWIIFYEHRLSKIFAATHFKFEFGAIKGIWLECLPLFLSSFLITYIINMPKYSIDSILAADSGIQTAYNAVFQPAAVINLMCLFVFRPTLTKLATLYNEGQFAQYIKTAFKIFLVTCIFSGVVLVAAAFLGIPVLQFIYGKEYIADSYNTALIFIIIGGAFYAFSQLLYNMITVIRRQHLLLIGYAVVLISAYIVSNRVVLSHGIFGAAALYMFSMIALSALFLLIFALAFKNAKKQIK